MNYFSTAATAQEARDELVKFLENEEHRLAIAADRTTGTLRKTLVAQSSYASMLARFISSTHTSPP